LRTDERDVAVVEGDGLAVRVQLGVFHALGAAEGVHADELEFDVLLEHAGHDAGHLRRRRRPEHLDRHFLLPRVDLPKRSG
jgi:hypothetical protein